MKYSWNTAGFSADATKVGNELEKINNIGELTNKEVLEYAEKHRNSELAKCFEWDDTVAGKKWRLRQATELLCSISIVIDENKPIEKTRVYVSTRKPEEEKRTFKKFVDVLEDNEAYNQLLEKAKEELSNCELKYKKLLKLQDLKEIIFELYKNL